jgi:outer membrane receptor protein involved in Fe transport
MKVTRKSCVWFFLSLLLAQLASAGDTGKLVGTARDATTNEALPGLTVSIVGTALGAATNDKGFYFINTVPPGTYDVRFSFVGYQTLVVREVQIMADVTTEQNAAMSEASVELAQIEVTANRPMVQRDRTSSQSIVEGNTISRELLLTNVNEVLELQAGVTRSPTGDLHIRGGRAGGIAYQVDGVPVVNPFERSFAATLEVDRVQELQAHLGTFDAEFGNAADGMVSIITRDGGDAYRFKFQYESPRLNSSPYQVKDWNLNRDDIRGLPPADQEIYRDEVRKPDGSSAYDYVSVLDDPFAKDYLIVKMLGSLNASVSGPVPFFPELKFFTTGRFRNEDGYLPFGYTLFRSVTMKLTYPLSSTITLRGSYDWSQTYREYYDHQYKYWRWFNSGLDTLGRYGSYPLDKAFNNRQTIQMRHVLSNSTFYDLSLSRLYDDAASSVPDRTVSFDPVTGELVYSDYIRRLYVGGVEGTFRYGDVRYWTRTSSKQYLLKGNIESQIDAHNQLRSGFELDIHDEIFRHRIGMPPLPNLQYFTKRPVEGAIYLQDKLEYSFMILKAGMRLDYFDPRASTYPDPSDILRVVTSSTGTTDYQTVPEEPVSPHVQFSPRIGIAHPISERTSIHFAYGHFFQVPRFYDLYRNNALRDILVNDALVGNPGLKPEKTVSYELGIQHQFSDDWAVNLTAYTKDITNLTSSFYYFVGRDYTIFTNADFGRVQGFDLTLDKRLSMYYSGRLTYSFMYAMGNQSDPSEGYNSYREETAHLRPNRDYFLDFDQRHKINLILTVKLPENFGPTVFGVKPFEWFNISAIFTAGSGLPYTPTSRAAEEANIVPEPNSARKPWTSNLDLKITRDFRFSGLTVAAYLDVENLFDNLNVVTVWTRTGEAWSQGPTSVFSNDYQADPENMGPPRSIRAGFIVEF